VHVRFVPTNPNPTNSNSAIFYLSQVCYDPGVGEVRPAVLLSLLDLIASKPCFHTLRTVQRLGYTAGCTPHRLHGSLGFAVRVQSADKAPHLLRERVEGWLTAYREELAATSPERFGSFKAALTERYLEPPPSLGDAASRAWGPIRKRTYSFDRRQHKANCLTSISLPDLLQFYDQHVLPGGPTTTSLCCEVWGGPASKQPAQEGSTPGSTAVPASGTDHQVACAAGGAGEAEAADMDMGPAARIVVTSEHVSSFKAAMPLYRSRLQYTGSAPVACL